VRRGASDGLAPVSTFYAATVPLAQPFLASFSFVSRSAAFIAPTWRLPFSK
jgi:hypothetical protein